MTTTEALADLRPTRNTSSDLSKELRRAIMTLYHAHWPDHRIAAELNIRPEDVARWRASRFLSAK